MVDTQPFVPRFAPEMIDDLNVRLRITRWPDELADAGWSYGMSTPVLRSFVATWLNEYDWDTAQRRLAEFSHHLVPTERGRIHVIHEPAGSRGGGQRSIPLLLLHGWPSSFVQMLPIIRSLAAPDDRDDPAFDVVAMSLPGYGFSDRPTVAGADTAQIADTAAQVMSALGYDRFMARGSDLGAGVLQQLALRGPERLIGLHLSGTNPYLGPIPDDLSDAEREFVDRAQAWGRTEMAYAMEHATKPQTLAHALNDSPAGLASWILEKFRRWSDCGGDLDAVFDRSDLITNIVVYWATQTIGSSMRLYAETARSTSAAWGRVEVPTAMAMSGADMFPTPREWAERSYNVVRWTELERGGHFLEWETPDAIVTDLRQTARAWVGARGAER